jgi:hypothetical protein
VKGRDLLGKASLSGSERQIGGRDIGAAQSDTDFTAVVKPIIGLNLTNIALSIDQTYMHADHAWMQELSSGCS